MGARVLIVDDDGFTRSLLVATVTGLGHVVVGDCANGADAMKAAAAEPPDVALLDLDLGSGPTGADVGHGLRRRLPKLGIVILTSYEEPRLMGSQLRVPEGAIYLVKQSVSEPREIDRAIRLAREPRAHTQASGARDFESAVRRLSDGQVEIMRLVADGLTNAEIGRRRYMSEHAVGKAVARLVKQLDLDYGSGDNPRVLVTQAYFAMTGAARPRRD